MSKDNCYDWAHSAGNNTGIAAGTAAGAITYSALAPETVVAGTVPAALAAGVAAAAVGSTADHAVEHGWQWACDTIYDDTSPLFAVNYDQDSHTVTGAFGHQGSSDITFEDMNVGCNTLQDFCLSPESDYSYQSDTNDTSIYDE